MKTRSLSTIIILSLIISSCGDKTTFVNPANGVTNEKAISDSLSAKNQGLLDSWKRLTLTKDKNNFALAKLFAGYVSEEDREEVEKFIDENLNQDEINSIIENVGKNYDRKKLAYLYHDAPWIGNQALISDSLNSEDELGLEGISSFEKLLLIETSSKIKNKFLEDILISYSTALENTALEMSSNFIENLQKNNPRLLAEVEVDAQKDKKEQAVEKLRAALLKVEYFNYLRKDAAITDSQLVIAGLAGAIAYQIYDQVKDSKEFNNIKKVISTAQEIKNKITKASKIVQAINEIQKNTFKEAEQLKNASVGLKKTADSLQSAVRADLDGSAIKGKPFKDQMNALYRDLFTKKGRDGFKGGAYENQLKDIDKNLNIISNSFSNMATNFDAVLNNSLMLADTLGIKLGKDAQKVVKAAQTVSKIINVAASTFKGFVTGGYVGGAMALMGSAGQLFGGQKENAEYKKIIDQLNIMDMKLDQIMALQQQTIQLQLDTMKMIRDLALMVDDFHQKEMSAIAELKDISLTNAEISKAILNKEIRSCESLIEYQLSDFSITNKDYVRKLDDADVLDFSHRKFYGNLKKYESFKRIVKSNYGNSFSDCQSGLNDAFGKMDAQENPIYSVFNSNENVNFLSFQRHIYNPLLTELLKVTKNNDLIQFPLHLPMKSMNGLKNKYLVMANPASTKNQAHEIYNFNNLISPPTLLRYSSSLLLLYPMIDFDKDDWEEGANSIINKFFADLTNPYEQGSDDYNSYLKSRSLFLLSNALHLTQSSIAQEALLSGEPILSSLYGNRANIFSHVDPCGDKTQESTILACAVFSNKLLLKNLLKFIIYKMPNSEDYKALVKSQGNSQEISNLLSNGLFKNNIKEIEGKYYLDLKVGQGTSRVGLPTDEELQGYPISYSENMIKLLKLQLKIIDAIISVSPHFMKEGLDLKYSAIILLNASR